MSDSPAKGNRFLIAQIFNDQRRVNVLHGFSLHNMTSIDSGMKLHLVLKFWYDETCIKLFGAEKQEKAFEKQ